MRRKRHTRHRPQIIQPIQMRLALLSRLGVVPAQEEVDRVRVPGAEGLCERAADPGRGGLGAEGVDVADLVEAEVAFDVFCEVDGVACIGG